MRATLASHARLHRRIDCRSTRRRRARGFRAGALGAQCGAGASFWHYPVHGTLDDADVLRAAAARADAVINSANADHEPSAQALLQALEGTGKAYIHTSGSSIVGTQSAGERVDAIFDEPVGRISAEAEQEFISNLIAEHN
jgi:hypothetical protein